LDRWRAIPKWTLPLCVAGVVGLGVLVFLGARSERDASAIQATVAYVLVIVTSIYVILTYFLVQAQRRQGRDALEAKAVVDLAKLLHRAKRFLIPSLERVFPLPGRGAKPDFERIAKPDSQLLDLYWDLNRLEPELPQSIRSKATDSWRAVWMASSDTINILWAFNREEEHAQSQGEPWSWDGAARFYREEHEVGRTMDPGFWYEMIRGERVRAAIAALNDLDSEVDKLRR
jgi:hypothetical protein